MCWMCEHTGSTVQDYLDVLRARMLKHGWAGQYVEDRRMPYAYSIGLTRSELPELLITGVSPPRALRMLNAAVHRALSGTALTPGSQFALGAGPLVEVVEVEQPDAHMGAAVAFFGDDLRAVQLVWADRRGRWPWTAEFCDGAGRQPVLGVRVKPA